MNKKLDLDSSGISAFIFDLDGVITSTAALHFSAWKRMFDEFLTKRSGNQNFRAFTKEDYKKYVDGKPREDGVRDFLASRKISLPFGNKDDPPEEGTIYGLGNRKNGYFLGILEERGPKIFDTTVDFVHELLRSGIKTAVISSSHNCKRVLEATGVEDLFDAIVDGNDLDNLEIPGKPDPAMFFEAARRLRVASKECALVEDSIAGVKAGRRGGLALVIGVDRTGDGSELKEQGADITVSDLQELKLVPVRKVTHDIRRSKRLSSSS